MTLLSKPANTAPKTEVDPRAARLFEIKASMAAYNRCQGRPVPRIAQDPASVDPTKLRRLAEIRLAALAVSANSEEHRKLSYAIQVSDSTGVSLLKACEQLGVDTPKLVV